MQLVTQPTAVVPTETKGNNDLHAARRVRMDHSPRDLQWCAAQPLRGRHPAAPQAADDRVVGAQRRHNNVQDSVVIDYPPSGIQTLGFIALQVNGDSTALDSQGNPWSTRVQAPPVTVTQTSGLPTQKTLTIYPDQNGCAFAQVEPGTYTVALNNATTGQPFSNDTYGSPPFVENALGSVSVQRTHPTPDLLGIGDRVGRRCLEAHRQPSTREASSAFPILPRAPPRTESTARESVCSPASRPGRRARERASPAPPSSPPSTRRPISGRQPPFRAV